MVIKGGESEVTDRDVCQTNDGCCGPKNAVIIDEYGYVSSVLPLYLKISL